MTPPLGRRYGPDRDRGHGLRSGRNTALLTLGALIGVLLALEPRPQQVGWQEIPNIPALPFPLGVYEDANLLDGNPETFEALVADLRAHGFDSVMLTNGSATRDDALLTTADRLGFAVYFAPAFELEGQWWPATVPADLPTARRVLAPLVAQLKAHPSLQGYYVADEPGLDRRAKLALAVQVFREEDPTRPVLPVLIGLDRVGPLFAAAQPDVLALDIYPVGANNPLCDFTLTGFGYTTYDFVRYVRAVTRTKPTSTPLWTILQTHRLDGLYALREPAPVEVRLQHWLALGEGATGLFWFVYSSQQGWTGLRDNPALYDEAAALARRTAPLRPLLGRLRPATTTRFAVAGGANPYLSTLLGPDGATYVVVVNRDCQRGQDLTVTSRALRGQLRDLESGQHYPLGAPIPVPPGDGRLFELVGYSAAAPAAGDTK